MLQIKLDITATNTIGSAEYEKQGFVQIISAWLYKPPRTVSWNRKMVLSTQHDQNHYKTVHVWKFQVLI